MSDERLSPELDGTGAGFGKNKGITVRELSGQFARLAEDGTMRSFSAVLRISREQIEARGEFGVVRLCFFLCFGMSALGTIWYFFTPTEMRRLPLLVALGGLVASAAFATGLIRSRTHVKASFAQVGAIRDLSLDALAQIAASPAFKPKPLDFTQRLHLRELLKKTKRNEPALEEVLKLID